MKRNDICKTAICFIGMLIFILDAKTSLKGASDGINVCLQTVIPSLFPLLILSVMINSFITGKRIRFLEPVRKLCSIPCGAESVLVLGLVGGYPVGAQCIYQSFQDGQLTRSDCKRMLMFCNNAGPAFIFGISASVFASPIMPWRIWLVHIISAIIVGILSPNSSSQSAAELRSTQMSFKKAMDTATRTMASICCWVILFRIIIHILTKWLNYYCTKDLLIVITGLLELTNGCLEVNGISSEAAQFIIISAFLGFGGCCVAMQTAAVTKELGIKSYLIGKMLQGNISIILSSLLIRFSVFGSDLIYRIILSDIILLLGIVLLLTALKQVFKKTVAFRKNVMYN